MTKRKFRIKIRIKGNRIIKTNLRLDIEKTGSKEIRNQALREFCIDITGPHGLGLVLQKASR